MNSNPLHLIDRKQVRLVMCGALAVMLFDTWPLAAESPNFNSGFFQGAKKGSGDPLKIDENETHIPCLLNALRFGPKPLKEIYDKIEGATRQEKLDHLTAQFSQFLEARKGDDKSVKLYFEWLNQVLPTRVEKPGPGLKLEPLPPAGGGNKISGFEDLIVESLQNDTLVILRLDRYTVESTEARPRFWRNIGCRYVVVTELIRSTATESSVCIRALDPVQVKAEFAQALLVVRPGNKTAEMETVSPAVDLRNPYLSIHGGNFDTWNAASWAQRTVTVASWAIVRK